MIENKASTTPTAQPAALTHFLEQKLATLGYELVALEVVNHREKKLRIFIDQPTGISIEDCVKATHELDLPLEESEEIKTVFKGPYELEISSPGIERPLQKPKDFIRFVNQVCRIHTFRPLVADETLATEYSAKNSKQKNFFGLLRGFENETSSILFGVVPEDGKRPSTTETNKHETLIRIPLELVSKAHLEPEIEFPEETKKKTGAKKS